MDQLALGAGKLPLSAISPGVETAEIGGALKNTTPIPAVLATVLATVCHVRCKFSFFLVI
jgi:hypothetical protein